MHLPVLKTPLSAAGHTYPIYGMKMVGTQNANNLISASTDGMVCTWLADMLGHPQVRRRFYSSPSLTAAGNAGTRSILSQ